MVVVERPKQRIVVYCRPVGVVVRGEAGTADRFQVPAAVLLPLGPVARRPVQRVRQERQPDRLAVGPGLRCRVAQQVLGPQHQRLAAGGRQSTLGSFLRECYASTTRSMNKHFATPSRWSLVIRTILFLSYFLVT